MLMKAGDSHVIEKRKKEEGYTVSFMYHSIVPNGVLTVINVLRP